MRKKPSIVNYLDYREFLKDAFQDLKDRDPSYTYRRMAAELGFKSIGHITWILQGKRNITVKMVDKFIELLGLNKKEQAFFKLIISFTNTKKHIEKKLLFDKIVSHQKTEKKVVSKDQYQYWDKWYHSAIREFVAIHKISDTTKKIGRMLIPHISPAEVDSSLKLLESLGLIAKNADGFYYRVDKVISTGEDWESLAIRQYQMEYLEIAKSGIEKIPKVERDISSVLVSISDERFEQIQKMIREFRQELITLARTDPNPQRIYQVGFQIFPVSSKKEENHD